MEEKKDLSEKKTFDVSKKKSFPEPGNDVKSAAEKFAQKIKGSLRPPLPGGSQRDPNLKHAEAFCHMLYFGKSDRVRVEVKIWNSRDGVTPMFCSLPAFPGVQLAHVNFHLDQYDPAYKPKKGDYIWRTWHNYEITSFAAKQFDKMQSEDLPALEKMTPEEIQKKYGYDALARLREIIGKGMEAWVNAKLQQYGDRGEPFLELVTEDWK